MVKRLCSNYSLEIVINKAAKSYFNAPYAVGNVGSSLALTPFHIIGIVNDGRDVATVYIDAYSVAQYVPTMWQVQNATIYWNSTHGLTTEQIYSALSDCIADTVGENWNIQEEVMWEIRMTLFYPCFK